MKIVSRISPIEATRYLENAETHKKGKRNGRKNVTVFSMAMANVTGDVYKRQGLLSLSIANIILHTLCETAPIATSFGFESHFLR